MHAWGRYHNVPKTKKFLMVYEMQHDKRALKCFVKLEDDVFRRSLVGTVIFPIFSSKIAFSKRRNLIVQQRTTLNGNYSK